MIRVAQLGRALGVHLVVAGQRIGSDLGPGVTALRSQLSGLVFASEIGTGLDAANVRRGFRHITAATGLDPRQWTPREMRHSFVSLLSDSGVSLEDISRLVGHSQTTVTETVYRKQSGRCSLEELRRWIGSSRPSQTRSHSVSHPARGKGHFRSWEVVSDLGGGGGI